MILFVNLRRRALLPDLQCGHTGGANGHQHSNGGGACGGASAHEHNEVRRLPLHVRQGDLAPGTCCVDDPVHEIAPHFAHVRFPLDSVDLSRSDFAPDVISGIDPITGKFNEFGIVLINREAVRLDGRFNDARIDLQAKSPTNGEFPSDPEKQLWYWVSNPSRFSDDRDLTIRSEFLRDDPPLAMAGYVDVPFGKLEPYFLPRAAPIWSFRPRTRGNKDHTQVLAQVVVKKLESQSGVALVFRKLGEPGGNGNGHGHGNGNGNGNGHGNGSGERRLIFKEGQDVHIFVGNTTRETMLLRPMGFARSPDHHYLAYYDFICPPQPSRPLPHLRYRLTGPPDTQGSNCPPIDPIPPKP
ncbi:MAG TPA: hypothetical protein VF698_14270 [Thermoanaerobaculia bacterium]